jgi:hypothetical protein
LPHKRDGPAPKGSTPGPGKDERALVLPHRKFPRNYPARTSSQAHRRVRRRRKPRDCSRAHGNLIDICGEKFGRWRVLGIHPERARHGHILWLCRCDCGTERTVRGDLLRYGLSTSCGCLAREKTSARMFRHGHAGKKRSPTYRSWESMRRRCNNPNAHAYDRYGGQGIKVCERYNSFENLLTDMGVRPPGTSIDRIDSSRGYEPGNVHWATHSQQNLNRRLPKRKRRRATLEELTRYTDALTRAAQPNTPRHEQNSQSDEK